MGAWIYFPCKDTNFDTYFFILKVYKSKICQKSAIASTHKFEKHGYLSTHGTHTNGGPCIY